MWEKINKITNVQAAVILAVVGFAVFFSGLSNPFMGDDFTQIVNNPVTHSISHFPLFFEGSTGYNGHGIAPLTGTYYRPLMMVVFSLLYTMFGAHTLPYHLVQLLFYIAGVVLLYLIFRYSFKPLLSLALSLVFLVHPLNAQVAYAIPTLQDALLFFFGALAMWLLLRCSSKRALIPVVICLFFALLSKEMGLAFLLIPLLYLFWFDRGRLRYFMAAMVLPLVLYFALKINAVGLGERSSVAPIDNASFLERLLTMPAILEFYITKFIFPWRLSAGGYYWMYAHFSVRHVLLPLIIDLVTIGCFIYLGIRVRARLSSAQYYTYLFFVAWAIVGIVPYMQILPLDLTASDGWFHLSMVGILGMLGVAIKSYEWQRKQLVALVWVAVIVICVFGVRSAHRGIEFGNPVKLSYEDIASGSQNYNAYTAIAQSFNQKGEYEQAKSYAQQSISIYPSYANYYDLGTALIGEGKYQAGTQAYKQSLQHGDYYLTYEGLSSLTIFYDANPQLAAEFLNGALQKFPQDNVIWTYLAVLQYRTGNFTAAKVSVNKALQYGQVSAAVYEGIQNKKPFTLNYYGHLIPISSPVSAR